MVTWNWTKKQVEPGDILDAARTIPVNGYRTMVKLTDHWVDARRYLGWAFTALQRGGDDGWDSAASFAKRAVCRQMDSMLTHNHLGRFLSKNYGEKADYLKKLAVPGLGLLKDLVIDPRNDIEHAYNMATEAQAQQAFEVADLFLRATENEAGSPAIIALGWNVSYRGSFCDTPGKEYEIIEYKMASFHPPMLLIDAFAANPEVFVLYSKDELLSVCPLSKFSSAQIIDLNGMLRQYLKCPNTQLLERKHLKLIREQLKL